MFRSECIQEGRRTTLISEIATSFRYLHREEIRKYVRQCCLSTIRKDNKIITLIKHVKQFFKEKLVCLALTRGVNSNNCVVVQTEVTSILSV